MTDLFAPDPKALAEALAARGYRRTSNRHRMISRIDRPDWVDVLARALFRAPADFYVPGDVVPAANWCDHYRRCFSRDTLTVDADVFKHVPGSAWDQCGYVPPFGKAVFALSVGGLVNR